MFATRPASQTITFVYTPCASLAEAEALARAAVDARLAACANILPQMVSLYRWDGVMERVEEVVLILKTREAHYEALARLIAQKHSYKIPCIAALPLEGLNRAYHQWLLAETEE